MCGIEFCYAAETAFVSPTLLQVNVFFVVSKPEVVQKVAYGISPGLILTQKTKQILKVQPIGMFLYVSLLSVSTNFSLQSRSEIERG